MKATVLGTGAWGTTFATVLAAAGCTVQIWGRDEAQVAEINQMHVNGKSLPQVELHPAITATTDPGLALLDADLIAVALPAQNLRGIVTDFAPLIPAHATVVSLMKGIEISSLKRMSEVLAEVWELDLARIAVVSGPNLAKEIAAQQPTATVVAATDVSTAEKVATATASSYFRPYTNPDVLGVELCGAYKNVIAVSVGIAAGMGFGHNTTATVITRGLAEITRLGLALGSQAETYSGLAGMGDLIATCSSPLSRNHTLGAHIGTGASLAAAIRLTGGTAEGVKTCLAIQQLARRHQVDVPICDAVVAMLHEGAPKEEILTALLSRPRKAEVK